LNVVEQITLGIVLVSVFIICGILIISQYIPYTAKKMSVARQDILDRGYGEELNTVLTITENASKRTLGDLTSNYITQKLSTPDKKTVSFGKKEIDVKEELKKVLDATYGEGNYYFEAKPDIKDIFAKRTAVF
jgi:hypothetical protein